MRVAKPKGARYVIQRLVMWAVFACALLAAAGRLDWPRGWGYLLATLLLEIKTLVLLAVAAPETLRQRGAPGPGAKAFDRVFAALFLALSLGTAVVAGLDAVRFGWSGLPTWLFWPGVAAICLADAFGTWAMIENTHFEQFVRIQADRGHRVVSTGPYRIVRHPGYLGAIVGALVTPLILGSAWTFVPAGLYAAAFAVRTALEDRTLLDELPGYREYAGLTRWRLLPGVW